MDEKSDENNILIESDLKVSVEKDEKISENVNSDLNESPPMVENVASIETPQDGISTEPMKQQTEEVKEETDPVSDELMNDNNAKEINEIHNTEILTKPPEEEEEKCMEIDKNDINCANDDTELKNETTENIAENTETLNISESFDAEMLEEVNINENAEMTKTSEELEKESEELDPMDTVDHYSHQKDDDDDKLDDVPDKSSNSDIFESLKNDFETRSKSVNEDASLEFDQGDHPQLDEDQPEGENQHREEEGESHNAEEEEQPVDEDEPAHGEEETNALGEGDEDQTHADGEPAHDEEEHIPGEDEQTEDIEDEQEKEITETDNRDEPVDDIHEGEGADEEMSLLPEREITEADKERAILAAAENVEEVTAQTEENLDGGKTQESQETSNVGNENLDETAQQVHDDEEEIEPPIVADPAAPKDFEIKDAPTPHTKNSCVWCRKDKVTEFMYIEKDETKYICNINCMTKLRADKAEQFTVNLKKIPVIVILESKQQCARCKKKKMCNYRLKNDEKFEYLCETHCLNLFIGNGERYVLKKKRYLIDDTTNETEQKCIQCSELKICKYSFKQEDDELFICHEDCLNLLLKEQPDKIRVKRRSVRVRELPLRSSIPAPEEAIAPVVESTKIVARSEKEAEEARQDRENSFIRQCIHCMQILNDPEKLLTWETLDFCNEICLGQYQNIIGSSCAFCHNSVSVTSLGKYCVRFGYEIKQFCRSGCLDEYKKGLKVCSYCQRDISTGQQGFLAPVGDKGQFKDFCTQGCMKKYDEMCNPKKKSDVSVCAVCNNDKPVRVEVMLDEKQHKFCSNPCFSAFKFVNNVYPDQCQMCQKYFERKSTVTCFTIFTGSQYKMFCTKICMNIYIITNRKIVPCNWCKVKKYNFDMITKTKSGQITLMCSLNCLTLCEVSMNAVSMTTLKCDQCNVLTMPQYLLSMSDASIRNFCTYQCVMAFQSQFSKAPLVLEGETTNALPIPTGLPKRVRKENYANQAQQAIAAAPTLQSKSSTKSIQAASKSTNKTTTQNKQSALPIITNVTSLAGTSAGITTRSTRSRKPSPPPRSAQKSGPVQNKSIPTKPGPKLAQIKQYPAKPAVQKGVAAAPSKPVITTIPLQNLKVSLERINTDLTIKKAMSTRTTRSQPSYTEQKDYSSSPSDSAFDSQMDYSEPVRAPSPIIEIKTQIVVVPPVPKKVSNITTMCKPIMQTKGVTCRPQSASVECQTDDDLERKMIIPVPVPIYIPQPMYMYSLPMPIPVPIPLPIPVPVFIPTTRNSANGIMKEIKKIQDKMPTDPFEAELLMMAEMVAGDKKRSESESGSDIDGQEEEFTTETIENSNAFGEDMLQMALKMATEYDEPAVDLESAMPSNTITPNAHPHIPGEELVDDPAIQHHHMLLMEQHRQLSTRGRKRGSGVQNRNNNRNNVGNQIPNKKPRREISQIIETQPEPPREPTEKADANMCLKFTFGVNAWKQWVMTKNADLEKSSIRRKPFKSDLLQLTADELNYSLCLFVKEVRKPNGSEYAPDTIYYLVLGIQQYLYEHGRIDNIFTDPYYEKFTDCLDEVARKFSVLYNDSQYIVTRVEEEHLWECKQLGAHSPHVLLSTLMFFNTKHFNLTTVEEHMQLSFSHIMKHWKRNPNQPGAAKSAGSRNVLLRFYPPQSSLESNARKKKVYEQQENEENPLRCPVKLYEFYLSKCPESVKTRSDVFYLQPERSCVPDSPVWYSTQALSKESLSKMLHRVKMVKEINIALLTS